MANLPPSRQGHGQAAAMADAASAGQHRREIGEAPLEHRDVSGRNPRRKHRATLPSPLEGPERLPAREFNGSADLVSPAPCSPRPN
jgi:hypothetical protein